MRGWHNRIRIAGLALMAATLAARGTAAAAAEGGGEGSAEELAKQLANPVASLISVPFQSNLDVGGGFDGDAYRFTLNVQPVVPFTLSDNWNLISRTILPVVYQKDVLAPEITPSDVDPNDDQFGLGDTVQSLFFSPAVSDPIWGVGPVVLIPTATDNRLGTEKWGAGPTGVVLKQSGPWTYGALVNHIWSFAGDSERKDVNATFLQPFVSYTTPDAWTYSLSSESTRNWEANEDEWTVPINAQVTRVVRLGDQLASVGGGVRYYVAGPDTSPDWGVRFLVTLLFPR